MEFNMKISPQTWSAHKGTRTRGWLEWEMADLPAVRAKVAEVTAVIATAATANLAEHKDTGDSEIKVIHGDLDGFVVLDDTRGEHAAWAIENGTKRSKGTHVLKKAVDGL